MSENTPQPLPPAQSEPLPDPQEQQTQQVPAWAWPVPEPVPAKPKRHFPWRWVGAVVSALAVGAGCAFAVMAPHRTDLPGLKTASDGRYDFGPLELPTLAPGQSDPMSSANAGVQHLSDIRKLLLSPPFGAESDKTLPGTSGWVSLATTEALFPATVITTKEQFDQDGWRHTAGIAWKTQDGAETKIYLMQFIDESAAEDAATVVGGVFADQSTAAPGGSVLFYTRKTNGSTTTWYGQVQVGDTQALIVYTAPSTTGITPFEQESDLQIELLQ